ncbi:uncharacterized protein SAPINGB_P006170 [Magnusiomyces paraingens]|uniref:Uncharacterized protein n=1 Tax=Magnusiomyces paraingens TaxID=2606893 RepID=A0A5E8CAR2_9ASCO|nr:uncharacterized protein SAPINGB_P006170 [Saprochaete ingens]VVT58366.1 unnamed protein product [Saprochaete ingens]
MPLLSSEALKETRKECPARDTQVALLSSLLAAGPSAVLIHGAPATGKTRVLQKLLENAAQQPISQDSSSQDPVSNHLGMPTDYVWVECDQCNTARIMLQRALRGIKRVLKIGVNDELGTDSVAADNDADYVLPSTIVHGNTNFDVVTENISAYFLMLQMYLARAHYSGRRLVLVLDRIDQIPDNPSDIISCLARTRELAPGASAVTTLFVTSTLEPRALLMSHVPHVRFSQYSREDTIRILCAWGDEMRATHERLTAIKTEPGVVTVMENQNSPQRELENLLRNNHICRLPDHVLDPDKKAYQQTMFWDRYASLVVSALASYTGSDIRALKELARRLWPAFIAPLVAGRCSVTEIHALWRESKHLFESEAAVSDTLIYRSLIPAQQTPQDIDPALTVTQLSTDTISAAVMNATTNTTLATSSSTLEETTPSPVPSFQFPTSSSSSSSSPPSSSSHVSATRSSRRRSVLPLKPAANDTNDLPLQSKYILCAAYLASYNPPRFDIRFFSRAKEARAKRRDTGRRKALKINPRLLAAPAFDLERMLAILHAVAPNGGEGEGEGEGTLDESENEGEGPYSDRRGGFPSNIDLGVQIATLTTLRLLICLNPADPLDSKTRWKINANWVIIKRAADEIGLAIEHYLIE